MQHNEKNDEIAKLFAFLVVAKSKLEAILENDKYKFIRQALDRGIELSDIPLGKNLSYQTLSDFEMIRDLITQYNDCLTNKDKPTPSFAEIQHKLSDTQKLIDGSKEKSLLKELSNTAIHAQKNLGAQTTSSFFKKPSTNQEPITKTSSPKPKK